MTRAEKHPEEAACHLRAWWATPAAVGEAEEERGNERNKQQCRVAAWAYDQEASDEEGQQGATEAMTDSMYWKSGRQLLHVAECAWGLDNQSSKRGSGTGMCLLFAALHIIGWPSLSGNSATGEGSDEAVIDRLER